MRTGLTKQEKTTDIWFDEKDPLIHIRTHNTDLKKRLAAYAGQHPDQCRQTDADPDTGCMEFEIRKGRFSFRLTAPYSDEDQDKPITLSTHEGQEFDYIISGSLKVAFEDHVEILNAGDAVLYNSAHGHGMIATGGEDCVFLAIILKKTEKK